MFHSHIRHSHMIFYVMQWSATRLCGGLSVHSRPLPSEKKTPLGSPVKIAFWRFLFDNDSHSVYITFRLIMLFRNSCQMPFHELIPPFAFIGKGGGGSRNQKSTIYVVYVVYSASHAKCISAKSFPLLPSQLRTY